MTNIGTDKNGKIMEVQEKEEEEKSGDGTWVSCLFGIMSVVIM